MIGFVGGILTAFHFIGLWVLGTIGSGPFLAGDYARADSLYRLALVARRTEQHDFAVGHQQIEVVQVAVGVLQRGSSFYRLVSHAGVHLP